MNTADRAHLLAEACRGFEKFLGPTSAEALLGWVRLELGHEAILDGFQKIGSQWLQAIAPRTILHIVSGNTPHAALQSLARGFLLGSRNLCKLPSAGLPEASAFAKNLPVELSETLPDEWLAQADAVIVFGSDETIAHFRACVTPHQIFLGYGHRISLGIVFEDAAFDSAPLAARDASLFDQQGCLSPHCIYVANDAEDYAARLAVEMARIPGKPGLSLSEAAAISETRETARFRQAVGQPVRLWEGESWTVIYDADPTFVASPLNRLVFVRPLPPDPTAALFAARPYLSTIAIWPNTRPFAEQAAALGASRVCALGRMQEPPWTWRQDGHPTLSPLVTWRGWEPACD